MKLLQTAILVFCCVAFSQAGFRCTFGDRACSLGCKVLGQSGGMCDDDGDCWCSEKPLSLAEFRELLPSRCTLGAKFCRGTCHAIGRRDGSCVYGKGCECSETRLSPKQFGLCAAESTCRIHCQANGKATGECRGWDCRCLSQRGNDEFSEYS